MKFKKLIAAVAAAAMAGSLAISMPLSVSAEKIDWSPTVTVFQSDANTTWWVKESKTDASASIGGTDITSTAKSASAAVAGSEITLVSTAETSTDNAGLIQVRPVTSSVKLENGVEYTVSINYTATIEQMNETGNAVYATVRSMYMNGTSEIANQKVENKKGEDAVCSGKSGVITATITPTVDDAYLEIQLYLRRCKGTVTYNSITVTKTNTTVPENAAVSVSTDGALSYYTDLSSALTDIPASSTVTLLKNQTINDSIIALQPDNLTINGNSKTLTLNKNIEFITSGTVNISDIITDGSSKIDAKGKTKLYVSGSNIANLQYGGATTAEKGSVTNTTVGTLTVYGHVTLTGTTVQTLTFPSINNSSDQPNVTTDSTSSIVSAGVTTINENAVLPYTLFSGELIPTGVTVPDGYSYENGVISKKTTTTEYRTAEYSLTGSKTFTQAALSVTKTGDSTVYTSDYKDITNITVQGTGSVYVEITNVPASVATVSVILK